MRTLFLCIMLLCSIIQAQDLIYTTNKTLIECEINLESLESEIVTYLRYDKDGQFQISKSRILFIQDYKGNIVFPKEVIGIKSSKKLHWENAKHYHKSEEIEKFKSLKEGVDKGYTECAACFDFEPFIPDQQLEKSISAGAIKYFKSNYGILYEDKRIEYVQNITNDILKNWPEKLVGYKYRVLIYAGPPNAMAIPGGNIYVSDELLDLIESELELRAILAHEIAHVEKRHALREFYHIQKQKSIGLLIGFVLSVAAVATDNSNSVDEIMKTVAIYTDLIINITRNGYSRELEEEADLYSVLYFQKNALPATHIKSIWEKFADYLFLRRGDIYNTSGEHPSIVNRISQIENMKILQLTDATTCNMIEKIKTDNTKIKILDKPKSFSVSFTTISLIPSSIETGKNKVLLNGYISNEKNNFALRINNLILKCGTVNESVYGLKDFFIPRFSNKDFIISLVLNDEEANNLIKSFDIGSSIHLEFDIDQVHETRKGKEFQLTYNKLLFENKK